MNKRSVIADALAATASLRWLPQRGPQCRAYFSDADVLLYGGAAGGGKTDIVLGLAFTQHQRSLICRRQYTDCGALIDRALRINGTRQGFNGAPPARLTTRDGRIIEFFAAAEVGSEQHRQGQAVDFLAIDEAAQWQWSQVRFLMGWLRSTDPQQRTRCILASNPPIHGQSGWLLEEFAPWLDDTHANPARPGELRWFYSDEHGKTQPANGPEPVLVGKKLVRPTSRTFIPAKLQDNVYLSRTDYARQLDAFPEPLRSALRDGDFTKSREDDPQALIPAAWLMAAKERWSRNPPFGVPQSVIAADVAMGGDDETVIACRYDGWFQPLICTPGRETPSGSHVAGLITQHRRNDSAIVVDAGGGYGLAAIERLQDNGLDVVRYVGAERATGRTVDARMPFLNRRSESYWRLREALDSDQPDGSPIALPNDSKLISQLASIRYSIGPHGVQVERKEDVIKRLGRSPDRADALMMCWSGPKRAGRRNDNWGYASGPDDAFGRPRPRVLRW